MAETQGISAPAVAVIFAGGLLAWSGVKGYKLSYVTQDLISGKDPAQDPRVQSSALTVSPGGIFGGFVGGLLGIGSSSSSSTVSSTGGSVGGTAAQNKALGQKMTAAVGWTGAQWTAFNNIVMAESGWSATVTNPGSGAAGIAQKISGFGSGYQSGNAPQQIAWMIQYIQQRYGDPINAWNFHLAHNWY